MTTIDNKKDVLYLSTPCYDQIKEKEEIINAFISAVRWFASALMEGIPTNGAEDLYFFMQLLEEIIASKINKSKAKEGEIVFELPHWTSEEHRERLTQILISASNWYVLSDAGGEKSQQDVEGILKLIKLQKSSVSRA
jgi:hypothetical protein